MILADLPYNTTACKWDNMIPLEPLWEQYKRIIKDNGAIVLTASQPFTSKLIMSNPKMFRYCWYWEKERLTNVAQVKKRPGKIIEEIVVFYKNQPNYKPQMVKYYGPKRSNKVKNGKLGYLTDVNTNKVTEYNDTGWRYPTQVLKFKRDTLKSNLHPTQKPVALFEYLIKTYTNKGDLVLDNVSGSGTTGVACQNLGRNFILIEKELEYVEICEKRLAENSCTYDQKLEN
jgi:site-specific DNA-methyltransferase (adenine-specific)